MGGTLAPALWPSARASCFFWLAPVPAYQTVLLQAPGLARYARVVSIID